MVRVPGDTDDPDDIMDDPPVWPFSIVILHGAIVGALLAWVVGWVWSEFVWWHWGTRGPVRAQPRQRRRLAPLGRCRASTSALFAVTMRGLSAIASGSASGRSTAVLGRLPW